MSDPILEIMHARVCVSRGGNRPERILIDHDTHLLAMRHPEWSAMPPGYQRPVDGARGYLFGLPVFVVEIGEPWRIETQEGAAINRDVCRVLFGLPGEGQP